MDTTNTGITNQTDEVRTIKATPAMLPYLQHSDEEIVSVRKAGGFTEFTHVEKLVDGGMLLADEQGSYYISSNSLISVTLRKKVTKLTPKENDFYIGCDMANGRDVTINYSVKVTNEFLDAIMSKEQRVLAGHKHYYRNATGSPEKLYRVEDDKYIPCGKENSAFSGAGFCGIATDDTGEKWIVIQIPFVLPPDRRYARLSEVEFIIED